MEKEPEVWKDIEGYEGLYQISSHGRVKSLEREVPHKTFGTKKVSERILKAGKDKDGYLQVQLSKNNKTKPFKIHRLVGIYFVDNPDNKLCINHDDGNKQNNYYKNIKWCTHAENMNHGRDTGLINNKKKVAQYDLNGNLINTYESTREAGENLNTGWRNIGSACRGDSLSCKGYQLEYYENKPPKKIDKYKNNMGGGVKINQLNDNKVVIKTWDSITQAANHFNIKPSTLNRPLKNSDSKSVGYYWEYAN